MRNNIVSIPNIHPSCQNLAPTFDTRVYGSGESLCDRKCRSNMVLHSSSKSMSCSHRASVWNWSANSLLLLQLFFFFFRCMAAGQAVLRRKQETEMI